MTESFNQGVSVSRLIGAQLFSDDLDEFTYALMEGICGKDNMLFERGIDIPNTEGNLNNM